MDNKKDIRTHSENKPIISKDRNALIVFLTKKTEKLAAAIFLVSDFMSEQDPLRLELRAAVLKLLSDTLSRDERSEAFSLESAGKLSSLLQIAFYAKLISEMNWQIFKSELEGLIGQIESGSARPRDAVLSAVFFETSMPENQADQHAGAGVLYKGQTSHSETSFIKDTSKMSFKGSNESKATSPEAAKQGSSKNNRREEILAFFRKNKKTDVSIKDISSVMKDCSEKTIQRELIDLVQKGALRKEGERRWSRYSLLK